MEIRKNNTGNDTAYNSTHSLVVTLRYEWSQPDLPGFRKAVQIGGACGKRLTFRLRLFPDDIFTVSKMQRSSKTTQQLHFGEPFNAKNQLSLITSIGGKTYLSGNKDQFEKEWGIAAIWTSLQSNLLFDSHTSKLQKSQRNGNCFLQYSMYH